MSNIPPHRECFFEKKLKFTQIYPSIENALKSLVVNSYACNSMSSSLRRESHGVVYAHFWARTIESMASGRYWYECTPTVVASLACFPRTVRYTVPHQQSKWWNGNLIAMVRFLVNLAPIIWLPSYYQRVYKWSAILHRGHKIVQLHLMVLSN